MLRLASDADNDGIPIPEITGLNRISNPDSRLGWHGSGVSVITVHILIILIRWIQDGDGMGNTCTIFQCVCKQLRITTLGVYQS